jgi:hypothetical protein
MTVEPEVVFSMDLANGPTTERFCYEAMQVLGTTMSNNDARELANDGEFADEVCQEWTERLEDAGFFVWWNAGDVVVYDMRPLSDMEQEQFLAEMEGL